MVDKRIELCENVVSTDYIEGNTLHYFTYATEWTDKEHVIKFDTVEKAIDWYYWHFRGRCAVQGEQWAREDGEENISNGDAIATWRTVVESVAFC